VPAGPQRACHSARDACQIGFPREVIERIKFAQDEVDRFRQPQIPHIGVNDVQRQALTAGLLARQTAHHRGKIYAPHADSPARQLQGRCAGTAGQVARGRNTWQNAPQHCLARLLEPREMKGEQLIVVLRQPTIGRIRGGSRHVGNLVFSL
jgi:hypothetical protein